MRSDGLSRSCLTKTTWRDLTNMTDKQLYKSLLKAEDEATEARSILDKFLVESDGRNDPEEFQAALNNRNETRQAEDKALKAFIDQRPEDR